MTFEALLKNLNVSNCILLPDSYYPAPKNRKSELCSLDMIDALQEKYNLFDEYYNDVRKAFLEIEKDALRKLFLDSVSLFLKDADYEKAEKIRCPEPINTPASNMLPLLVHLPSIDKTYNELIKIGLTHEDALSCLSVFKIYLKEEQLYRTKIIGLSSFISFWLCRFTKLQILYFGKAGINFHMIKADSNSPYFLKNKNAGKILPVYGNNFAVHSSGIPLGSAGATANEGSFIAEFKETDDAYIGHASDETFISKVATVFKKSEWDLIVSPSDDVITLHIFWDSDLTPDIVQKALDEGVEKCKRSFPDKKFKAIRCCSWLMNPYINEILGENSKLSQFSSRFVRFPIVSGATLMYHYVFPGQKCPPEEYVAGSRLQKGVKQLLMDGKYFYETCGIIPIEQKP